MSTRPATRTASAAAGVPRCTARSSTSAMYSSMRRRSSRRSAERPNGSSFVPAQLRHLGEPPERGSGGARRRAGSCAAGPSCWRPAAAGGRSRRRQDRTRSATWSWNADWRCRRATSYSSLYAMRWNRLRATVHENVAARRRRRRARRAGRGPRRRRSGPRTRRPGTRSARARATRAPRASSSSASTRAQRSAATRSSGGGVAVRSSRRERRVDRDLAAEAERRGVHVDSDAVELDGALDARRRLGQEPVLVRDADDHEVGGGLRTERVERDRLGVEVHLVPGALVDPRGRGWRRRGSPRGRRRRPWRRWAPAWSTRSRWCARDRGARGWRARHR